MTEYNDTRGPPSPSLPHAFRICESKFRRNFFKIRESRNERGSERGWEGKNVRGEGVNAGCLEGGCISGKGGLSKPRRRTWKVD